MSDYQQRPNTGVLFRNERPQSDASPNYQGELNVGGVTYSLAGWVKQGKRGKFLSLAIRPEAERSEQPHQNKAARERPIDELA
jgi:hypothetical protein